RGFVGGDGLLLLGRALLRGLLLRRDRRGLFGRGCLLWSRGDRAAAAAALRGRLLGYGRLRGSVLGGGAGGRRPRRRRRRDRRRWGLPPEQPVRCVQPAGPAGPRPPAAPPGA